MRAGVHAAGEGDRGLAACPFDFMKTWVNNPDEARAMSEAISRDTHGYVGADLAALCTEAALQVRQGCCWGDAGGLLGAGGPAWGAHVPFPSLAHMCPPCLWFPCSPPLSPAVHPREDGRH